MVILVFLLTLYCTAQETSNQCLVLSLLAESLAALKNYEKAVEIYNKLIILTEKLCDMVSCIRVMLKLGSFYMFYNKYKLAITVFEKGLHFCIVDSIMVSVFLVKLKSILQKITNVLHPQ
jgi:tetratricopeptide (TPR) repeat protein